MKQIFVNLKRFDVPQTLGGVNRLAPIGDWAGHILCGIREAITARSADVNFTFFFPEAHLIQAVGALGADSPLTVGCQGVYREDVAPGGNFGAFTAACPAAAAKALGCGAALIGHCEERRALSGVLAEAGAVDSAAVNRILNREIACAVAQGLRVLYCIGETVEEQSEWERVLLRQLKTGLDGIDPAGITIAYEPVWAIGPGKTPPDKAYIQRIARFVKEQTGGLPVVYGGGLKADNAAMLASIEELDGGLIALTRFAGEIGFYPEEFLDIVRIYLRGE